MRAAWHNYISISQSYDWIGENHDLHQILSSVKMLKIFLGQGFAPYFAKPSPKNGPFSLFLSQKAQSRPDRCFSKKVHLQLQFCVEWWGSWRDMLAHPKNNGAPTILPKNDLNWVKTAFFCFLVGALPILGWASVSSRGIDRLMQNYKRKWDFQDIEA